ncbi:MAG: DUF1080 domain-containing protein [Planctomycetota bacterium]
MIAPKFNAMPQTMNPFRYLLLGISIAITSQSGQISKADATHSSKPVSLIGDRFQDHWYGRPARLSPQKLAAMSDQDRTRSMKAWTQEAAMHWHVDDGILVNDGEGHFLATRQTFGDYELKLEYRTVPKADSGIYLKGCPQVQIWDPTNLKVFNLGAHLGSGGLWNQPAGAPGKDPFVLADKPFGQWNTVRVIQIGSRTSVWLNDSMVVDHVIMDNYWDRGSPLPKQESIILQTHGGEIAWRNIEIQPLSADQANAALKSHQLVTYRSIFDGKTLQGWIGDVDDYEITDLGAIRCRSGRGGNLLTKETFDHFSVRLQFRLPPGGNNGLAIRAPRTGNPAYQAMTELQVLDDGHPKYANLDPRQAHGSAYGMVAAIRGYLRPTGQWNFQQVDVIGSKIRVELNGNVILNADLDQVEQTMADSPHPGKDRLAGHFGFAGHSDPVEFRDLWLKRLPGESSPAE